MSATERLHSEQFHHDRQALRRRVYYEGRPDHLRLDERWFLHHESWVDYAFKQLGDVRGRSVLDYGCGHGMASVLLAKRGARVTAFDLSPMYLEEARLRAKANGVDQQIEFVHASAEQLPFSDAAFDCVWGSAILHHLDLWEASRELLRVMKPAGVAVFCEPWGENPILEWARQRLPYPSKMRSVDERPLKRQDLTVLQNAFADVRVKSFQLLSMIGRVWKDTEFSGGLRPPLTWLQRCDDALLERWPGLGRWCRYVVITLRKAPI